MARKKIDRRGFLRTLSGGAVAIASTELLAGCGGSGKGSSGTTGRATVTVFPNPGDNNLAAVTQESGQTITYFGTKDAQGLPVTLFGMLVDSTDLDPTKRTNVMLDAQTRPTQAIAASGATVGFNYISATEVDLTITTATGSVKGPFKYNPTAQTVSRATNILTRIARFVSLKRSLPRVRRDVPVGSVLGQVVVTCGGSPLSGASVTGTFTPNQGPSGQLIPFNLSFTEIGPTPGIFQYLVPISPFVYNDNFLKQQADQFAQVIQPYCDIATGKPGVTSGLGLDSNVISTIEAQLVGLGLLTLEAATVGVILTALVVACAASSVIGGLDAFEKVLDTAEGSGVVQGSAVLPGRTMSFSQTTNPKLGNPANINVDFSATPMCTDHVVLTLAVPTIQVNQTDQASGVAKDKNNNTITGAQFEYSSDNSTVASVDPNTGVITGKSEGMANITATEVITGKVTPNVAINVLEISGKYTGVAFQQGYGSLPWYGSDQDGSGRSVDLALALSVDPQGNVSASGDFAGFAFQATAKLSGSTLNLTGTVNGSTILSFTGTIGNGIYRGTFQYTESITVKTDFELVTTPSKYPFYGDHSASLTYAEGEGGVLGNVTFWVNAANEAYVTSGSGDWAYGKGTVSAGSVNLSFYDVQDPYPDSSDDPYTLTGSLVSGTGTWTGRWDTKPTSGTCTFS